MSTLSGRISEDITWASLALLYYDYALTFPEEVELIWGVKFTPSTLLYILCRYAMLANLLYALAFLDKIGLSCDTWYKIIAVLAVFGRAAVIVTFTLRTYAIWAQSRLVLVLLAMIGLATVITDAIYVPQQSCEKSSGGVAVVDLTRLALTIVFETLSAVLVFIRCLQAYKSGDSSKHSFTYLLMQEGAVYFCIVSFFTIATFVLKFSTSSKILHDLLNALTLPLSGLLTARFLLHLRGWSKARSVTIFRTTTVDIEGEGSHSYTTGPWSLAISSNQSFAAEFGEDLMDRTIGPTSD